MQACLDFPDVKAFLDAYLTRTVGRPDPRIKAVIGKMDHWFRAMELDPGVGTNDPVLTGKYTFQVYSKMACAAFEAAIQTAHIELAGQPAVVGSTTATGRLRKVSAALTKEQVDFSVGHRAAARATRCSSDPSLSLRPPPTTRGQRETPNPEWQPQVQIPLAEGIEGISVLHLDTRGYRHTASGRTFRAPSQVVLRDGTGMELDNKVWRASVDRQA